MKDRRDQATQAELQAAIRKFIAEGGIIRKLPDQKAASERQVGARWNAFEMGGESN